jgi:hypothetical protein
MAKKCQGSIVAPTALTGLEIEGPLTHSSIVSWRIPDDENGTHHPTGEHFLFTFFLMHHACPKRSSQLLLSGDSVLVRHSVHHLTPTSIFGHRVLQAFLRDIYNPQV